MLFYGIEEVSLFQILIAVLLKGFTQNKTKMAAFLYYFLLHSNSESRGERTI